MTANAIFAVPGCCVCKGPPGPAQRCDQITFFDNFSTEKSGYVPGLYWTIPDLIDKVNNWVQAKKDIAFQVVDRTVGLTRCIDTREFCVKWDVTIEARAELAGGQFGTVGIFLGQEPFAFNLFHFKNPQNTMYLCLEQGPGAIGTRFFWSVVDGFNNRATGTAPASVLTGYNLEIYVFCEDTEPFGTCDVIFSANDAIIHADTYWFSWSDIAYYGISGGPFGSVSQPYNHIDDLSLTVGIPEAGPVDGITPRLVRNLIPEFAAPQPFSQKKMSRWPRPPAIYLPQLSHATSFSQKNKSRWPRRFTSYLPVLS